MKEKDFDEIPLKTQVGLKLGARPHDKIVKFSKWYHAQSNAQNSFFSMVEHMIDRFGYVDICDHEIAKKLHTEMLHFSNPPEYVEAISNKAAVTLDSSTEKEPETPSKTQTESTKKPTGLTISKDMAERSF